MYRIAVFVTGRGSNLRAIYESIPTEMPAVEISAVVTNKADCGAVEFAEEKGIPIYLVSQKKIENFVNFDDLIEEFQRKQIDLIVLAGFLKKIPDNFVDAFEKRIINIHPALLPSFGGKGMYGMNVHKAVFNRSAQVSGPTVHFVDKIYDNGKIIAQRTVDISDVETPEDIAAKVLKEEHKLLPYVVKCFAENKIKIENERVYIKD